MNAKKRDCMIFCISSNGTLLESAKKRDIPYLKIPSEISQPRAAFQFLFLPSLIFLERLGLVSDVNREIQESIQVLNQLKTENEMERPFHLNFTKKLASKINLAIPVIYGFGIYRGVTKRFKQELNENSKIPAKYEFFPELNHNEIVSWETQKEFLEQLAPIFIRDENEPDEIRMRIEATKELIETKSLITHEIWSSGETDLAKMLSTVYIGDLVSLYLAILRGIDPAPVRTIDLFKEKMIQTGVKKRILNELQYI
jgi:glucose/mannose-6-phosphate isomerase